jgi:hypothetical protein
VPDIAIELVSVEKGQSLKPRSLQMPGKDFAVDISKLGAMPVVIESLAKVCLGKFDFAEGPYTIRDMISPRLCTERDLAHL